MAKLSHCSGFRPHIIAFGALLWQWNKEQDSVECYNNGTTNKVVWNTLYTSWQWQARRSAGLTFIIILSSSPSTSLISPLDEHSDSGK